MYKKKYFVSKDNSCADNAFTLVNHKAILVYGNYGFPPFMVAKLKELMLDGFNAIERTIKGTFNCDIFMKNADLVTLKKMFPFACGEMMFNLQNKQDIMEMGRVLEDFRNLNAHYNISKLKEVFSSSRFDFIKKIKPLNDKVVYYYEDQITVAGIIFIMLCFLRENAINKLVKNDYLIGIVSCGDYKYDDGVNFVKNISKTNLDIDIRKESGTDLFSSIVGEYKKFMLPNGECNSIVIGLDKNPTLKIDFSILDDTIRVSKDSLTATYYSEEYKLKILNKDTFINYSNNLPPFAFVDYLYEKEITVFDDAAEQIVKKDYDLIIKLNHPKFYVDKNMHILLLGSKWADFRLVASMFNTRIRDVLLSIESKICTMLNENGSPSLHSLLKHLGLDESIIKEVRILRNFVAHGYIVGESCIFQNELVKYTFENSIATLKKLYYALSGYPELQNLYKYWINHSFVNTVIKGKYKSARNSTLAYMDNPNPRTLDSLKKSVGWIINSGFDVNIFLSFGDILQDNFVFRKIDANDMNVPLYISYLDDEAFNKFIEQSHYKIISSSQDGFLETIKIER